MIALPDALLRIPLTHRGYHDAAMGRIENSASAIRAAVQAGYGVELDLQVSLDGQAMVFHDDTLDRLTDTQGPVRTRSAQALGQIALAGGSGDTIPTFAQILALIAGKVPLLVELKSQGARDSGALERATAAALRAYRGPVAVMSFDPRMVARLADLLPHVPRGLTTGSYSADWPEPAHIRERLRQIPDYQAVGASFISHQAADLHRPRVAHLKAQGAKVLTWTIRTPEAEAQARTIADNITFEGYAAALP